jgi:GntR family transcriptional repressor for pyruvate dehydrogenase complex
MKPEADAPRWGPRGEKVAGVVARQIVRDIAEQGLGPGAVLGGETAMLQRYRVSRASLREALRILEIQGLISIKPGPGGGPTVCEVDSAAYGRMATLFFQTMGIRFSKLVDARLLLEPMMAALAANRRDPEDNEELRAIVYWGRQAETHAEWLRASDAFHAKVLSMSGNELLTLVARSLTDSFRARVSGLSFEESERDRVRSVHEAIADAVIDGNAQVAQELMREHMEEYAKAVAQRHPSLMDEVIDWG